MNDISPQRALEIINGFKQQTIVVVGDIMLDEFVWGEVTRISPEAPVPVVDIKRESVHLGGAANVLSNLISLGVKARVVGIVGKDQAAERVKEQLHKTGAVDIEESLVVDEARPTTIKTRIIAHNQLVVRADRERRTPAKGHIEEQLIEVLKKSLNNIDALIVSDYDKGVITPRILSEVLPFAKEINIPVLIDPKIRNFEFYRPATLVTPNHHEALRLTNLEDASNEGMAEAARRIIERLGCDAVLITRGERGMLILEKEEEPIYVETVAREVYDVTGAGDTVIATLGAALAAKADLAEAAVLANHAAGIVVGKVGTATTTPAEILTSIGSYKELDKVSEYIQGLGKQGK
jgi:D-glycero-beta-D-manno-heptose-7-phosphate kinase